MRDIVRDAAIITVAREIMTNEACWMSVEAFILMYSKSEKEQLELRSTLNLFGLVQERYEKGRWDLEGTYVWYWVNE